MRIFYLKKENREVTGYCNVGSGTDYLFRDNDGRYDGIFLHLYGDGLSSRAENLPQPLRSRSVNRATKARSVRSVKRDLPRQSNFLLLFSGESRV